MMTAFIRAERALSSALRAVAHPFVGSREDFDPLLARVGDAGLVLLGEASHGTHEFYRIRAEITKRLIRDCGFRAIAVEADWPDAYRVNRFVRGRGRDAEASEALADFVRFPQWMWRNAEVLDFVGWLRSHNDTVGEGEQVGFYGLDLYSLHRSMAAVLDYLRIVDPAAAHRAQERYSCFDQFGDDPQRYAYAAGLGLAESCENEVVDQLLELRTAAQEYARRDGRVDPDALFFAEENARLVRDAERYYRAMVRTGPDSWNLRDQHMCDTLAALARHVGRGGGAAKIVVWAHNSHLGDARATEVRTRGELNVGQLVRERWNDNARLIGFTTYAGSVTAASNWDDPAEHKIVRPALPESYEAAFHDVGIGNFYLDLRAPSDAISMLRQPLLERAIGVIYRPETERLSHYFHASLPAQFDGVLHYDRTRAVEPLERSAAWVRGAKEMPETYPTAL
ncbi:MAG TPA: erythromycin esterase family protein [Gemmatimonadaceae bacterium]|jgi:erythromycin esterase-like protein